MEQMLKQETYKMCLRAAFKTRVTNSNLRNKFSVKISILCFTNRAGGGTPRKESLKGSCGSGSPLERQQRQPVPTRGDPGCVLRQVASQVTLLVNHCRTETHPSDREGTGLRTASFTLIFCARIIFVRPILVQAGSVEL